MEASSSDYRIDVLLCDSAQVVNGKLYLLGGAWSVTLPIPQPSAIAIVLRLPAGEAGAEHTLELALFEVGGEPFALATADGAMPLRIQARFDAARAAAGVPEGTPACIPLAIGLGPLQYEARKRYEWRFTLDGIERPDWALSFAVADLPA